MPLQVCWISLCPPSPCWEIPEASLLASQGSWVTRLSSWPLTPVGQCAGRNVGDVYLHWDWWCPGGSFFPLFSVMWVFFLSQAFWELHLSLLQPPSLVNNAEVLKSAGAAHHAAGMLMWFSLAPVPTSLRSPCGCLAGSLACSPTDLSHLCQKVCGLSWLESNERERALLIGPLSGTVQRTHSSKAPLPRVC